MRLPISPRPRAGTGRAGARLGQAGVEREGDVTRVNRVTSVRRAAPAGWPSASPVSSWLETGRLGSGNVEPDAHFLAGLEIGDALGVDFHYFARPRVAAGARTARSR